MNPNFVRKRKDDTIRGPYEPSAPKIYRPSGKKSGQKSSDDPFRRAVDHVMNICFSYCRKFIASSCWSFAKFESSMACCNFLTNNLARYQKYKRYDRISFMYPGLSTSMTHTVWVIRKTHKNFQGKIIMSFCMQVPAYRRLPVEIRQELLSKSINELTVLFLSCNFNKKLQIIQFDDTEIDDRKVFIYRLFFMTA